MNHIYKVIFEPVSHLTKVVNEYCHAHHQSSSVGNPTNQRNIVKAAACVHKEHPVRSALLDALHSVHVPHLSRHEFLALTEALAFLSLAVMPMGAGAEDLSQQVQNLQRQVEALQQQLQVFIKKGQTGSGLVISEHPDNQKAKSKDSIAIGETSEVSNGEHSLAMMGGKVNVNNSVAIGDGANVESGGNSLAMLGAKVKGTGSVAIGLIGTTVEEGNNSLAMMGGFAKNNNSVAVGAGSKTQGGENNLALMGAETTGTNIIAIGKDANVNVSGVDYNNKRYSGIAIGQGAVVQANGAVAIGANAGKVSPKGDSTPNGKSATDAVAIGSNSGFSGEDSKDEGAVALGAWSKTDRYFRNGEDARPGWKFDENKGKWAVSSDRGPVWMPTTGAVSVGSGSGASEITRRITHVAAGYNDTDAVNVAQLKTVEGKVGDVISGKEGVDYRLVGAGADHNQAYTVKDGSVTLKVENKNDTSVFNEVTINGIASESSFKDGVNIYETKEQGGKIAFNLRDQVTLGGHEANTSGNLSLVDSSGKDTFLELSTDPQNRGLAAFYDGVTDKGILSFNRDSKRSSELASTPKQRFQYSLNDSSVYELATLNDGFRILGSNETGSDAHLNSSVKFVGAEGSPISTEVEQDAGNTTVRFKLDESKLQLPASGVHYYGVTPIGDGTTAEGSNFNNEGAKGTNSIAAGFYASASGTNASAFGNYSAASAEGSTALGSGSEVEKGASKSIALGTDSKVEAADVRKDQHAVYFNTQANGSFLKNEGKLPNGYDNDPIWNANSGVLSVGGQGDKEYTRRIIHVAAGVNETDAVNVAQLKSVGFTVIPVKFDDSSHQVSGTHFRMDYSQPFLQIEGGRGIEVLGVNDSEHPNTIRISWDPSQLTYETPGALQLAGDHRVSNFLANNHDAPNGVISSREGNDYDGVVGNLSSSHPFFIVGDRTILQQKKQEAELAKKNLAMNSVNLVAAAENSSDANGPKKSSEPFEKGNITTQVKSITIDGDGNTKKTMEAMYVELNRNLDLLEDGSIKNGNSYLSTHGYVLTPTAEHKGKVPVSVTQEGVVAGDRPITHVADGTDDYDAVNVGQAWWNLSVGAPSESNKGIRLNVANHNLIFEGKDGITITSNSATNTVTFSGSGGTGVPPGGNDPIANLVVFANESGTGGRDPHTINLNNKDQNLHFVARVESPSSGTSSVLLRNEDSSNPLDTLFTSYLEGTDEGNDRRVVFSLNSDSLKQYIKNVAGNTTTSPGAGDAQDVMHSIYADDGQDHVDLSKDANSVQITGDGTNIETAIIKSSSGEKPKVAVRLKEDIKVNSVNVGDVTTINNTGVHIKNGPSLTINGINAGGKTITNVAPGVNGTDAVNVNQLNASQKAVFKRIHDVDRKARAGIAQAIATAGLPQAYLPGKNLAALAAGTYGGESGFAVGVSSISDDGKWIFKVTGSANTRGQAGGSVGVGYQW